VVEKIGDIIERSKVILLNILLSLFNQFYCFPYAWLLTACSR